MKTVKMSQALRMTLRMPVKIGPHSFAAQLNWQNHICTVWVSLTGSWPTEVGNPNGAKALILCPQTGGPWWHRNGTPMQTDVGWAGHGHAGWIASCTTNQGCGPPVPFPVRERTALSGPRGCIVSYRIVEVTQKMARLRMMQGSVEK